MREPDRGERGFTGSARASTGERRGRVRRFASTVRLQEALRGVGPIDPVQFRADIDAFFDRDPTPRAYREE